MTDAGSVVTVTGVADEVKGNPRLTGTARGMLYVRRGLDSWPPGWLGKRVIVTGQITDHPEGDPCTHDPEPCQGIPGPYSTIDVTEVHLAP